MATNDNETPQTRNLWEGLSERQIHAVSYKLANPDATYADIEAQTKIPASTLGSWRLNQIVETIRANQAQAILDYTERVSLRAIRVLETQLDSADERVAQSAAKELLDRFLGKATHRTENRQVDKEGNDVFTYLIGRLEGQGNDDE